ncbi:clustered mitochondria domain-containing protein [Ditylenchus destructor]|nr:clustered mitochondria domain-containing protein [Ditylenchus destructor]
MDVGGENGKEASEQELVGPSGKQVEAPDTAIHDDSGHESNMSTPDAPSTPHEGERSITPGDKNADEADSSDGLYHIRILIPNGDPIEIQELYHVLLERDATCTRTCFKIYYENKPLDHFTEIRNIAKIKNQPYNVREARIHIRHLREILRALDSSDASNGIEFASFSFLSAVTHTEEVKRIRTDIKSDMDCLPAEYILPGCTAKDVPLKPLVPVSTSKLQALKSLAFSLYNPPPGPRKMKGDILYLVAETMEERRFHITCCSRGFYVNSTTDAAFNPEPSTAYHRGGVFHSLFDLLSELSPQFRRVFPQMLKARAEKHVYERLPTPYQTYSWIVPSLEHTQDQIRADDLTQPHRIGLEDHVPGQVRDWNEEIQTTQDMPRSTFTERICRDRAKFKVHSDFLAASVKGAMHVIDGNVLSINAMDDPKTHMFIWNNIFFSLGFDVKDHYKELGGDAAAYAATTQDLNAVRAYAALDHPKIHTIGMAIVDYKGYRLTAQSIIPGILEKDQEESVIYGSYDSGKSVVTSEAYEEFLVNPAKQLKIQPHRVWNGKEEGKYVTLYTSYESKGIIGNDGRKYLLDLLRTFPPDVNFLEDGEVTELCRKNGFPLVHKHKLVTLRQELIDAFVDYRYLTFMRIVSALVQKHCIENKELMDEKETKETDKENIGDDEVKPERSDASKSVDEEAVIKAITSVQKIFKDETNDVVENQLKEIEWGDKDSEVEALVAKATEAQKDESTSAEEFSNKIVAEATKMLGSYSDQEFDIRFNPDCYCKTVQHAPEEDLVSNAAEFILAHQIPMLVRDCTHQSVAPIDGSALVDALHTRGINLRYLGKIIESMGNIPRLGYVSVIAKTELLCRCARHLFLVFMQNVDSMHTGAAVAHFLNCLMTSCSNTQSIIPTDTASHELLQQRKSNKKSKRKPSVVTGWDSSKANGGLDRKSSEWKKLTQKGLWSELIEDAAQHYGYKMIVENFDQFVEWSGAHRTSVLRRFCTLNYPLDASKQKTQPALFIESDIHNLIAVVKHLNPRAQDAHSLYLTALSKMQNGFPRIALCLRLMARMAFALGDLTDALSQQHKAVMISERCNGFDHHETILDYVNMSHYSFANLHIASSLKLLYRARFLLLVAHGEDHPVMAQIDANIGIILYAVQEYEHAIKFLNNALKLYSKYDVTFCLKTALLYHIIARTHSCRGEFRQALSMEKETFNIYSKLFGEDHEKTKMSSECLRHLTKQAVNFQKRMNGAASGQGLAHFMPMNIQPPSLQNIIEMLNVFNNFIFLKIQSSNALAQQQSQITTKEDEPNTNKEGTGESTVKKEISTNPSDFQEENLD